MKSSFDQTKLLDEYIWKTNFKNLKIQDWLSNFTENSDKDVARKLLNQFVYFNNEMIREMLISLYRDVFLYPIRQQILKSTGITDIEEKYLVEVNNTRFLGMGNPSESGTFLLYYFRQVNNIPKDIFIDASKVNLSFSDDTNAISRYVFIDDMSISGSQIYDYATNNKYAVTAKKIKKNKPDVEIHCYLLFATSKALSKIREANVFNTVESIFELDESYECFGEKSRYFSEIQSKYECQSMAIKYGEPIKENNYPKSKYKNSVLGFDDSQLLLGLEHNTPNNTLPIFWSEIDSWKPIFKRYGKNYGS